MTTAAERISGCMLGQPARIDDPQMTLEGAELYFSRGDSQAGYRERERCDWLLIKDLEGRPLT